MHFFEHGKLTLGISAQRPGATLHAGAVVLFGALNGVQTSDPRSACFPQYWMSASITHVEDLQIITTVQMVMLILLSDGASCRRKRTSDPVWEAMGWKRRTAAEEQSIKNSEVLELHGVSHVSTQTLRIHGLSSNDLCLA